MSRTSGLSRLIFSLITLIIGIFIFIITKYTVDLGIGIKSATAGIVNARTMPYIIASGIILLSISIIISDNLIRIRKKEEEDRYINEPTSNINYRGILLMFIFIVLWTLLVPYIGFIICTILLVTASMLLIGNRDWRKIILMSIILSFLLDYLLKVALNIYFPQGILFG